MMLRRSDDLTLRLIAWPIERDRLPDPSTDRHAEEATQFFNDQRDLCSARKRVFLTLHGSPTSQVAVSYRAAPRNGLPARLHPLGPTDQRRRH